jgi:hypothetical protein
MKQKRQQELVKKTKEKAEEIMMAITVKDNLLKLNKFTAKH